MIWFEESFGIEYCTENLEYSLHLASDIYRHSSPDNYWCFVQFYTLQTTNHKTLCKTFADCASQLRFVSSFQQLQDTTQGGVDFNSIITSENLIFQSLTSSTAIGLKGTSITKSRYCLSSHPILKEMYSYGILVGTPKFRKLYPRQLAGIQCYLSNQDSEQLPSSGQYFTKLQKTSDYDVAVLFQIGELL